MKATVCHAKFELLTLDTAAYQVSSIGEGQICNLRGVDLKNEIETIKKAQSSARRAFDAYVGIIDRLKESERIFARENINVTVDWRSSIDPKKHQEINAATALFCGTYLNFSYHRFYGEEENLQNVLWVSNLRNNYSKEFEFHEEPPKLEDRERNEAHKLATNADAAMFLRSLMADLINCHTKDSNPIDHRSIFEEAAPPKVGERWGGVYGFTVREQLQPEA